MPRAATLPRAALRAAPSASLLEMVPRRAPRVRCPPPLRPETAMARAALLTLPSRPCRGRAVALSPRLPRGHLISRGNVTSASDKGLMDSALCILTKLDIVLEDVIGCEVELLGAGAAPTSRPLESAEAAGAGGEGEVALVESSLLVKVDHRFAARLLVKDSAHRSAFELVFQRALASSIGVDQAHACVLAVEDADASKLRGAGASGAQGRKAATLVEGALAAAPGLALASETTSRVAAFFAGAAGAPRPAAADGPPPLISTILVVRYSITVPAEAAEAAVARLREFAAAPAAGVLGEHCRSAFKKGAMGRLSDLLERSNAVLRQLEPRLDPGFRDASRTLGQLEAVLERSNELLRKLEPKLDPAVDDLRSTLQRLDALLARTDGMLRRAEDGLDGAALRGNDTLRRADALLGAANGLLAYVKFALLGVGVCGFAVAFGICRVLVPLPSWSSDAAEKEA